MDAQGRGRGEHHRQHHGMAYKSFQHEHPPHLIRALAKLKASRAGPLVIRPIDRLVAGNRPHGRSAGPAANPSAYKSPGSIPFPVSLIPDIAAYRQARSESEPRSNQSVSQVMGSLAIAHSQHILTPDTDFIRPDPQGDGFF